MKSSLSYVLNFFTKKLFGLCIVFFKTVKLYSYFFNFSFKVNKKHGDDNDDDNDDEDDDDDDDDAKKGNENEYDDEDEKDDEHDEYEGGEDNERSKREIRVNNCTSVFFQLYDSLYQ